VYASFAYLHDRLPLLIASIPLGWGIILLAMYLAFKRAGWTWWSLLGAGLFFLQTTEKTLG
jgi:hypothetical protein